MNKNVFRHSRAANFVVIGQIWPIFELNDIQASMHLPIIESIKSIRLKTIKKKLSILSVRFFRARTDNSILRGPIWSKFKLLDIMHFLNAYKFMMDKINSNREKVATSIF